MDYSNEAQLYDLVVIGAGISGLAMARFYLEVHPDHRLLILERDNCVGGTWSKARLYNHFWAQWAFPYAEFSDLPMEKPPPEESYFGFFKADHTASYLEKYADSHDFGGLSLRDRIKFNTEVKAVERATPKGWKVSTHGPDSGSSAIFHTAKLAIASGRTSVARVPKFRGSDSFNPPIIHTLDFARSDILSQKQARTVAVLGGGKSASDMAYAAVKAGKTVFWLVRPDGVGPAFYAPVEGVGPYKGAFDLGSTRFMQYLSPCVWDGDGIFSKLMHGSQRGIEIIKGFWALVDKEMSSKAMYDERQCKEGFDKLKPHLGIFWNNGPGGLINRKDFFETIASNVEIHYENVSHLDGSNIHLESGKTLEVDALLCGTGWDLSFGYCEEELAADIGLPYAKTSCADATQMWVDLDKQADEQILKRFPLLANPPAHFAKISSTQPFRLYRSIVPVKSDDHDLVVIGQVLVPNYFRATECQAMWATAYLDGKLQLPSLPQREIDVAKTVTWNRRRYLSNGQDGNNFMFESFKYCDMLLADLGLSSHKGFVLKDMFWPCLPSQMRGLKNEYLARYHEGGKRDDKREHVWAR